MRLWSAPKASHSLTTLPRRSFVRGAKLGQTVRIQSELVNMGPSWSFSRHPSTARSCWFGDKRDMTAKVLSEADPVLRTTTFRRVQAKLWLTPASSSTTPSLASSWHTVRALFSSFFSLQARHVEPAGPRQLRSLLLRLPQARIPSTLPTPSNRTRMSSSAKTARLS